MAPNPTDTSRERFVPERPPFVAQVDHYRVAVSPSAGGARAVGTSGLTRLTSRATKRLSCSLKSGPVAQLGARMTGSHEVEGSNPSRSTNSFNNLHSKRASKWVASSLPDFAGLPLISPAESVREAMTTLLNLAERTEAVPSNGSRSGRRSRASGKTPQPPAPILLPSTPR